VSYQVFARKYRPQTFDEVVGQGHITQTLKNAIEQGRLAHAYLFVGPRGTGKTSTARILAKALNCIHGPTTKPCGVCPQCQEIAEGRSLNVLEFDAASNTQVDKVRELIIDNVKYAPTSGRYKLYIVDEVHMLSNSSFNALLKTLEEPPAHVIFIFATTDPQKVPLTIISRCQRFDLRRIPAPLIEQHLQFIAGREKIELEPAAARAIARGAEGGLRDAESMLDQLVAFCGTAISEQDVLNVFGFSAQETVSSLCGAVLAGRCGEALGQVQAQAEQGKDLSRLMADVISHLRDLLVMKADPEGLRADVSPEIFAVLEVQSAGLTTDRLLELIEQFAAAENRMKWAPNKRLHFEVAIIKAVQTLDQATLSEILDTLTAIRSGGDLPAVRPPAAPDRRATAQPQPRKAPAPAAATPKPAPTSAASEATPGVPAAPELPDATPVLNETPEPPPAPSEPAAAAPEAEPLDPAALWPGIIAVVRRERPLITTWVEAGALLEFAGEAARIGFPPEQKMAMESLTRPNNRSFLEKLIAEMTGGKVRTVDFIIREGLVVQHVDVPAPVEQAPRDPMEEFKNDPLIRKALEIFQAEIQPA
jgi:DNA polymerase-3 subunit gamma/tau